MKPSSKLKPIPADNQCFSVPQLEDRDFQYIRDLVRTRFGINLTPQKRFLVIGRLRKLLLEKNMSSFREYRSYLEDNPGEESLNELVNRITTNHTYFFREPEHFRFMRRIILPEIKSRTEKELRVWCAAASSGEEPYSIVITMMEFLGTEYSSWDAGILATDISANALEMARKGVYSAQQIKNVSSLLLNRYFLPLKKKSGYKIRDEVRREVTFRRFNLMNKRFPFRKPFDLIFCRNVMIYFNQQTRDSLVERMTRHLNPGGYLLIGHSEIIDRSNAHLEYVKPAVYRKKQS